MKRFAIYYAPPEDSTLVRLAASWLGRDAFSGLMPDAPPCNGFSREVWRAITSDPRIYGFHATLKPPFRLAAGRREDELHEGLLRFAGSQVAFLAPPFRIGRLSSFLALTLSEPCPAFEELAAACVREFDEFRAPAPPEEIARRRRAELNPQQLQYLDQWGYPYVMDEWRFHMSLTSSLRPELLETVQPHLEEVFRPYCREPVSVDSICLFEQPDAGEPFRVVHTFGFSSQL